MIIRKPLIGASVIVIDAKNPHLKGLSGTIINETRNTWTLQVETNEKKERKQGNTTKTLIKDQVWLQIGDLKVKGSLFVGKPEERIKKKIKH